MRGITARIGLLAGDDVAVPALARAQDTTALRDREAALILDIAFSAPLESRSGFFSQRRKVSGRDPGHRTPFASPDSSGVGPAATGTVGALAARAPPVHRSTRYPARRCGIRDHHNRGESRKAGNLPSVRDAAKSRVSDPGLTRPRMAGLFQAAHGHDAVAGRAA